MTQLQILNETMQKIQEWEGRCLGKWGSWEKIGMSVLQQNILMEAKQSNRHNSLDNEVVKHRGSDDEQAGMNSPK